VEIARSFGAATVALTRPGTPLARAAEIVIPVTVPEDANFLLPYPTTESTLNPKLLQAPVPYHF